MPTESSDEERYLELYLYNTNRNPKINWESETSTGSDAGPEYLLEAFVDMLRKCEESKRHVTTAVCTRQSGLVYVSSEDDDWERSTPGPEFDSSATSVQIASNDQGHTLDLDIYIIGGSTTYKSTIPNDSPAAHFHLLRRFLSVLEYCRTNAQFTVQNAAYTDEGASMNILGSDVECVKALDLMLKHVA